MATPTSLPETARRSYWGNVWSTIKSTAVGMGITFRYLWSKPFTVQYPDEKLTTDERYRGIHYLEQDLCICCNACAKACPIDCIEMEATRHGKELEWHQFDLDYQKCMFCELCVYPCPKDCIHMGKEYALVTEDRGTLNMDLLTWQGLTEEQKVRIAEAEAKKAAKKAAKEAAAKKKAEQENREEA
ncbi:MAG: NADH-quinone oxidoreductase subunit I [Planctomycetota bacterium]|nr:MAG: NADH-quinone oxidoreductase subunit I [Planctomycetota bacterium]